jgi:hypothetical protein
MHAADSKIAALETFFLGQCDINFSSNEYHNVSKYVDDRKKLLSGS